MRRGGARLVRIRPLLVDDNFGCINTPPETVVIFLRTKVSTSAEASAAAAAGLSSLESPQETRGI
jgi:hypothetical protein